ncbi:hypothetical protein HMPREF0297_1351 [Corynebacterium jeikeium ATCC 43734]|nr:hypothetical protein HMPREF0297_1351 [Corynebacterium jeikeium ATCC 43734]
MPRSGSGRTRLGGGHALNAKHVQDQLGTVALSYKSADQLLSGGSGFA